MMDAERNIGSPVVGEDPKQQKEEHAESNKPAQKNNNKKSNKSYVALIAEAILSHPRIELSLDLLLFSSRLIGRKVKK